MPKLEHNCEFCTYETNFKDAGHYLCIDCHIKIAKALTPTPIPKPASGGRIGLGISPNQLPSRPPWYVGDDPSKAGDANS